MSAIMHLGDAIDVMASLPSKSVTHVIADPPYLGARGQSWETDRAPLVVPYRPATHRLLSAFIDEAVRVAQRWVLAFNDFRGDLFMRDLLASHDVVTCFQSIVWVKPPGAFAPSGSAYSPPKQVEFITAARARRLKGRPIPGAYVSPPYSPKTEILRTGGKPLSLMASIIADFTDPGDVVLDPFAGAGTTGVACIQSGRNFIGIEHDPETHALAVERLSSAERLAASPASLRPGQQSFLEGTP